MADMTEMMKGMGNSEGGNKDMMQLMQLMMKMYMANNNKEFKQNGECDDLETLKNSHHSYFDKLENLHHEYMMKTFPERVKNLPIK